MKFVTVPVTLGLFEHLKVVGASETVSALSDLLNSQPVTARQAADIAIEMGIHLPYGTLSGYWAGNHGRPTAANLKKLAQVVPKLSESRLQEAAWSRSAPLGPYQAPEESVHLSEWQRRALDELIRSVVETAEVQQNGMASAQTQGASPEAVEDQEDALDAALPPPEIGDVPEVSAVVPNLIEEPEKPHALGGGPSTGGDVQEDGTDAAANG